jgi:hypothetical protein
MSRDLTVETLTIAVIVLLICVLVLVGRVAFLSGYARRSRALRGILRDFN